MFYIFWGTYMKTKELNKIKDLYGENFAKFCRDNFGEILAEEGKLLTFLTEHFAPNKLLLQDITSRNFVSDFIEYVYSENVELAQTESLHILKEPDALLEEHGYKLYECKTEEQVNLFKKFYAKNEVLCTFNDVKGRLARNHIFFIVRQDVSKIKREQFSDPKPDDAYSTSVLCLQFSKGEFNHISIISRYNHSVKNPNATYGNDLNQIAPNLAQSFAKYYDLNLDYGVNAFFRNMQKAGKYILASDGKLYRFNFEHDGVYFCPNNVTISGGDVNEYSKFTFDLVDNYLIDYQNKTCKNALARELSNPNADLINEQTGKIVKITTSKFACSNGTELTAETPVKKIEILTENGTKIEFVVNTNNQIIGFTHSSLTAINKTFLKHSPLLQSLSLPECETLFDFALNNNWYINELHLPKAKEIHDFALEHVDRLPTLCLPSCTSIGDYVLYNATALKHFEAPSLQTIGDSFLYYSSIEELNLPSCTKIDNYFCYMNIHHLRKLLIPNVKQIGAGCLRGNKVLEELDISSCEKLGHYAFCENESLKELIAPNLQYIGSHSFRENTKISTLYLPKCHTIADFSFAKNQQLTEVNLPELTYMGMNFLNSCKKLECVYTPKLTNMASGCFETCRRITKLYAPKIEDFGEYCLTNLRKHQDTLSYVVLPKDIFEYLGLTDGTPQAESEDE